MLALSWILRLCSSFSLESRGYVGLWLCFFSKKNILIPNVAEKNILILLEGKKIVWSKGELHDLLPTNTVTPLALVICYNI
jgi:hypothetical protein